MPTILHMLSPKESDRQAAKSGSRRLKVKKVSKGGHTGSKSSLLQRIRKGNSARKPAPKRSDALLPSGSPEEPVDGNEPAPGDAEPKDLKEQLPHEAFQKKHKSNRGHKLKGHKDGHKKRKEDQKRHHESNSEEKPPLLKENEIIRNRWHVKRKLGGGGYGEIYEAYDTKEEILVAVKTEKSDDPKEVLQMEVVVLRKLQSKQHCCKFYGCGKGAGFNYLVMSLCGQNLSDLRRSTPHGYFSVSTTGRLAIQTVQAIEDMHGVGYLHRDIKPSNFAMGKHDDVKHNVYILDFGLARQFISPKTGEHRSPRAQTKFRGTVKYASLSAHTHRELSRMDDLWSWFYLLVEFSRGGLPWRRLREREDVKAMKDKLGAHKLIQSLEPEYYTIAEHIVSLDYYSNPDYELLVNTLRKVLDAHQVQDDDPFDWEVGFEGCKDPINLADVAD